MLFRLKKLKKFRGDKQKNKLDFPGVFHGEISARCERLLDPHVSTKESRDPWHEQENRGRRKTSGE